MTHIIERLFPAQFDNNYRGNKIALWLFYPLTALTLWRSQHHITAPDGGAQSIATIPLDTYTQGGAQGIVTIFALWGLAQLAMGLVMLLAAVRYKSMVPLLWLFIFLEYGGRKLVGIYKPLETVGTAPGATAATVLPIVAGVMLVLALWPEKKAA
ncbi:MAG: hypothetical protein ABJK59_09620 [Erythrobacter sp.]|uniref:hypothetical protein n=1 Tax=Erythrobacter sp. TaxID=1042 RepID=UPI003298E9FE